MRFTIETAILRRAVSALSHIIPKRVDIPVLGMALLSAEKDNRLRILGTDLDCSVEFNMAAEVEQSGQIACSNWHLAAFLDGLPDGSQARVLLDSLMIDLRSGRRTARLPTQPAENFPALAAEMDDARSGEISVADLATVARLAGICSTDQSRVYLSGPHLCMNAGLLTVEASDGVIAARVPLNGSRIDLPSDWCVIIPPAAARIMPSLFSGNITLDISRTKLRVASDGTTLVSKLIEGVYPDLSPVIPEGGHGLTIDVEVARFSATMKAICKIGGDDQEGKLKYVRLARAEDGLNISIPTRSGLAADETVTAAIDCGDHDTFGVSSGRLLSLIEALKAETIRLNQGKAGDVVRVEPLAGGSVGVIVPVRV